VILVQPPPIQFSPELSGALHGLKTARVYPKGAVLFRHGTNVEGVFLVEAGQIRILFPTSQGRAQLLDCVGACSVLGLSETMSGETYRFTAEAADHSTVSFIPRNRFLEFLRKHPEFCMQVVRKLSEDLNGLYHKFRNISAHPGRPRLRARDERLN